MSSLVKIYDNLLLSKGFFERNQSRPLIEYSLNLLEGISKEGGVLFLQLPTGYGKTAITYTAFLHAIADPEFFWRVIHIAPFRSIVDDIYRRVKEGLKKSLSDYANVFENLVGIQMMLSPGSPYLQRKLTITTFDTLSLSLAKMPVGELSEIAKGIGYGHFDIPRASILEALTVMDEVHAFLSESNKGDTRDAIGVLMSMLIYLVNNRVPLVLMSATMPETYIMSMLNTLKITSDSPHYRVVYYGSERVIDKDWESEQLSKRIETHFQKGNIDTIVKEVSERSSSYDKVLVILNTISRAYQVYCKLKEKLGSDGKPLVLLHSKFKKRDREEKLRVIKENKKWVLVSTQVVEAGVDVSAGALITDIAPANNLVQRAGRCARWASDTEGTILIVEEEGEVGQGFGVYDVEVLKWTSEELRRHTTNGNVKIMWRNLGTNDYIGYQKFVDRVYSRRDPWFSYDNHYYNLIASFEWTPTHAINSLVNLYNGSFLRSSPIIPLIVGPLNGINYGYSIEDCVPVDLSDLRSMLRRRVKVEKVIRKGETVTLKELTSEELKGYLIRALIKGVVVALYLPEFETIYNEAEGLIVEKDSNGCRK